MATIATEEEESILAAVRKGRPAAYPWDEWLDGRTWTVTRGADYDVSEQSFRTALTAAALRRGGTVKAALAEGRVIFRFIPAYQAV